MINKTTLSGGAGLGALLALSLGASAQAQDTTTVWQGAPRFSNEALTFKVRGRVYEDYVRQDVNREVGVDFKASNTRLRTARLGVEGTWNADWAYKAEVTLASAGGTTQWEDLTLEYKPNEYTSILAGNFKTVSLENINSSRYNTFMERGAYNDFIDAGRVMNVQVKTNGLNWTAAVAVSGDSLNAPDVATNASTGSREVIGFNGRATYSPILTDFTTVHLGVWARRRNREDQANFTYQVRNNTNYGARYVTSGAIGVQDTMVGLEGVWIHKAFSLQGEWANAKVDRAGIAPSVDFQGYYVAASWYLTGETRRFEAFKGEFNRTRILNPVTAGGFGAVELAVRYDNIDLKELAGAGEYSGWTFGANWHPHPYVRLQANYTMSKNNNPAVGADVDVDTLQFRAQFDF